MSTAAAAPGQYKIVPDQSELDSIERDLTFYPSTVKAPQVLTKMQVGTFNRDGFVRPIPIFSPTEITDLRNYFDDLLQRVIAAGGDSYSISSAHLKYGRVWDILTEPRIVAVV